MQSAKERIQNLVAKIKAEYDFGQFTIESFRSWLEQQRGKKITLVPWTMPPEISGVWLTHGDRDFIFYEVNAPPVHQVSIQLHQMAHLLGEHFTPNISEAEVETLALFIQKLARG